MEQFTFLSSMSRLLSKNTSLEPKKEGEPKEREYFIFSQANKAHDFSNKVERDKVSFLREASEPLKEEQRLKERRRQKLFELELRMEAEEMRLDRER